MNAVSEGQYCVTLHDEEMTSLGCPGPCREDTSPRDARSRAKGWFRGHTQICLALEVAATSDQGRYGIEIEIFSLRNCWVSILCFDQQRNEQIRNGSVGRKQRNTWRRRRECRETCRERTEGTKNVIIVVLEDDDTVRAKWVDIHPEGTHDEQAHCVSKGMIRLLRHGNLALEEDGAVEWKHCYLCFYRDFTSSQNWTARMWLRCLKIGGGNKKKFQHCLDPNALAATVLYMRAIHDHSGGSRVVPTLLDNVIRPSKVHRVHLSRWLL